MKKRVWGLGSRVWGWIGEIRERDWRAAGIVQDVGKAEMVFWTAGIALAAMLILAGIAIARLA